jgi:hypothetical protein
MASLLWAVDVNAIMINRVGKEDTLLLLFFVLAMWCYERGETTRRHRSGRGPALDRAPARHSA